MTYPVLYVVARTDLNSMNPGKLAAQVAHAASQAARTRFAADPQSDFAKWYDKWEQEAKGFGTTIVLDGGNAKEFKARYEAVTASDALNSGVLAFEAGIVLDPTYPVKDGSFTHLIPVETCWWVFGLKGDMMDVNEILSEMSLHK
ncbi:putative aminoacyl-tRNA hydrolase protein [Rhizobium phage RHph_I1_18]|nr:putative aminoacyl-tRNA hydrolase protein [Rhizobium phage RHph_I1_18]